MTRPVRVLFVEDSRDDVELIVHELRRAGLRAEYQVVDDPRGMRDALAGAEWDVVISDHSMPRFNAPAALAELKSSGRDLPFIVVSGNIGEELAVECMKAGAHDYVTKDHLARLVPAIQRELREAEQRRKRHAAEEALKGSEERYRLLVENSTDLISVLDREGRVEFISPSVVRVLGYERHDMLGKPVTDVIHPDDVARVQEAFETIFRANSPIALTGVRIRHRDGSWRTVDVSGGQLVDHDGQARVLTSSRDITDRMRLEQQLQQAQRMEAVGRLAGGVAHDFNNLLTVILGYSNLLLDQLSGDPRLHEEVQEINSAATRAANLTQQLLAFSRKQVLTPRVLDLNGTMEAMSGMLRRIIGEDVDLVLRLQPALGRVRVDPGQIEQVVMNLVVNARDAMPEGGRIVIETSHAELDAAAARSRGLPPGRYVVLAVVDNGQGMDLETQARIFEPFFTTKEPGKGTGLGLATVYGIIQQSGGHVRFESEPGRGTTFRIYLPRVEEAVERRELPPLVEGTLRGNETVLLVEDEQLVRNLVNDVLRRNGYAVLEARDGQEAIKLSARHRGLIHLMVTDVVMPGMNGLELARRLAAERPVMRVLYLSGYTDDLVQRRGALGPGAEFLQKPFTPETLLRKVRGLLDGVGRQGAVGSRLL